MREVGQLGEMTIKVPAPFAGIADLGFTAQYRAQTLAEPLRDVPFLIEGPRPPMKRLAELLQLLRESGASSYSWSDPVMLSDEVVVLAFRDRSLGMVQGEENADGMADYVLNLVRPVTFAFLHDCAAVAKLRLSEVIEMRVSAPKRAAYRFELSRGEIVAKNGDRLLWQLAG
jgi:hypothetical protein